MEIKETTKIFVDQDGVSFWYYPYFHKVKTHDEKGFNYALHYFGKSGFNIAWNKTDRELGVITLEINLEWTLLKWTKTLQRTISDLDSITKRTKGALMKENIDLDTGKPLSIGAIRSSICQMKVRAENNEISRRQIIDWFNKFNIEDDPQRQKVGVGKMTFLKTKSRIRYIEEGQAAIERLFKKGKLRRKKPN